MTDNKLYLVLLRFDKIVQNRLRKYIRSPYFNVNETLMLFYDILTNHINKNGKGGELAKESIWKLLFKGEAYNDVRFRKLCSDLLKLTEGFLAQEIYDDNNLQQASNLLESLSNRKIEKLYLSSARNAQLVLEQYHQKSATYYYFQYLIEKNYYEMGDEDMKRDEKSNVEKIINSLDEFYLAEKLKWYNNVLSRNNLISHEYKLLFIDEIIEHIRKHTYEHNSIITIYFQILLTKIESENENHFDTLVNLLQKYGSDFSVSELYDLYVNALNYCIQQANQGKKKFLQKYYLIYQFILEKEIVFHASNSRELSPWSFKNAIQVALRLGYYDWAEKFINNYQERLPKEFRENAVSYNLALVYFYQKKYDKATKLLRSVDYEDLAYNLDSKTMLLAMYYEQDEDEALINLIDTFKTYINRHKDINQSKRIYYLNYINFVRKMTKIIPGDKKAIEAIKQEIKDAKGVASEKWLLEKLAELE